MTKAYESQWRNPDCISRLLYIIAFSHCIYTILHLYSHIITLETADEHRLCYNEILKEVALKGKVKQVKGKVKEVVGKVTGNKSQEIKGKVEQIGRKVQEQYGKVKRNIKKAIGD